jgi:CBS domain containing-hemolysin-like protein
MIPKKNIFLLDFEAELSPKLLNHLGKYYFSKILVYSKHMDNIVGYMQFKQLLSFQLNQRISLHSEVLCRNLVRVYTD